MKVRLFITMVVALIAAALAVPARASDFASFIASMKPEALRLGVSSATFDTQTAGLTPDLTLPNLDRGQRGHSNAGQAEFSATPAQYLSDTAIGGSAAKGRVLYQRWRPQIAEIERRFGVPGPVVLAIFGRETGYGTQVGKYDGLRTLATQAWAGRRKDEFRSEFLYALKMLQDGMVDRARMKSSWAGAMGMTQMLPSQYYKYGVDLDGSGHADIWNSVPDALASIANHLKGEGWKPGEAWALEVRAPQDVDCTLGNPEQPRPLAQWLRSGFTLAEGEQPSGADARNRFALLLPAGPYGPGFLIGHNYFVLKAYNFSDLYVLYVGHLADRIAGGGSFATSWKPLTQPSGAALAAMQGKLAALGLYADKVDGKAGMKTRLAIGAFQKARGLKLDCWPSADVLKQIAASGG